MDYSDLNKSMGAFEGAVSSQRARVLIPSVGTILLVVEDSEQDPTAIALAAQLAQRLRAKICVTIGCFGELEEERRAVAQRAADELHKQDGVDAKAVFEAGSSPAKQILAAKQTLDAGIIVIPAPYLEDHDEMGNESLSSTIEQLLAESRVPLLLVRDVLPNPAECFKRFVLPMSTYEPSLARAAGWAFCLARKGAHVELWAVADQKAVDEASRLAGEDPDQVRTAEMLLRAEHKNAAGMVSAMQKKADETGIDVTVEIEVGDTVPLVLTQLKSAPSIAVLGAPTDRTSGAYHRAHDIALGAGYPVLIARE